LRPLRTHIHDLFVAKPVEWERCDLNLKAQIQPLPKPTKKSHFGAIPWVDDAHLLGDPPQANGLALSLCFFVTLASFGKIQLVFLG